MCVCDGWRVPVAFFTIYLHTFDTTFNTVSKKLFAPNWLDSWFFFFFTLILTLCSLPIIPVEYRRIWFLCTVFVFSWRQCTPIHSRYRSDTRYESYDRARERKKVDNHRFVVVCFFLSSLPSKKDRFLWLNSVVSVEECVRLMYRNDVDMVAHDKESERASKGSDLPKRGNTYHRVPLHRMYKIIDILCVRRNDREWFRLFDVTACTCINSVVVNKWNLCHGNILIAPHTISSTDSTDVEFS